MSNVNSPGRASGTMKSGMYAISAPHIPWSTDAVGWMDEAACRGVLDFVDRDTNAAKRTCNGVTEAQATDEIRMRPPCPVRQLCLDRANALQPLPTDGVWGGVRAKDLRSAAPPKPVKVFAVAAKVRGPEGPECGSYRGIRFHRNRGELPCVTCVAYDADRRRKTA